MIESELLEELVRRVSAGADYRFIDRELIRRLGLQELLKRKNLKEAVRATRSKLHQVAAAYQEKPLDYPAWRQRLEAVSPQDEAGFKVFCREMMAWHASTRERLADLETIFKISLETIGPVHSVLDVGCGLNPLTIPWMPLAEDAVYYGCDIYQDMVAFLNFYFHFSQCKGCIEICDLTDTLPQQEVQLALLLKVIPCLEQIDKTIGEHLINGLKAENLLVSFPARSLGGHAKGMTQYYEQHFREMIAGSDWKVEPFSFSNEIVFLLRRS